MCNHRKVLFVFILVCLLNYPAFANNSSERLKPAEKKVLEQVKKGQVADFRTEPKDNRILRADFLKELLTGTFLGSEVAKIGIHIQGARIKEEFDFTGGKISLPVSLIQCSFDKDISFSHTTFSRGASFSGTEFLEGVDFTSAEFSGFVVFDEAQFSGVSHFDEAHFSEEVNFQQAEFTKEAIFRNAEFSKGSYFREAEFSKKADFRGAEFSKRADFHGTKFFGLAYFHNARFSGVADFDEAPFYAKKDFRFAQFSGVADFREASLNGADLYGADLSGADLSDADLSDAVLIETDLKGTFLWRVRGFPHNYEPKAGSPPYIPSIANLPNLSKLTFEYSPHGLVDLREGFKKFGYREQERKVTYAIKYTQRLKLWNDKLSGIRNKAESLIYYILFEITCKYGMNPFKPLFILISLIIICAIPYFIVLKWSFGKDGIWKLWIPERARRDSGSKEPYRLNLKLHSAIGYGIYFSILSAFSIGWRELNVGNWISRIQRGEYALRATGWIRTLSGFQSLISVYLLALFVLTYFGRPFETF